MNSQQSSEEMEAYKEEIKKTGFVLEHKVSELLEKHGWNVITGRYYMDYDQETDREIDILAYKVRKKEGVQYYTALIISCKKSEDNAWCFLTRDLKKKDPNINCYPLSYWTNNRIIDFMINKKGAENIIKNEFLNSETNGVYEVDKSIFAFQQMNKNSGSPQNDKNMYKSVMTTIKALEYEKNNLRQRKKEDKAFYNFNLLSVFKGKMIELYFNEDIFPREIENIKYLNRHIVKSEDSFYRVHFTRYRSLENTIKLFNELASKNVDYYSHLIPEYYEKAIENDSYTNLLWNKFESKALVHLNFQVPLKFDEIDFSFDIIKTLDFNFDNEKRILIIKASIAHTKLNDLNLSKEKVISFLNEDNRINTRISELLEETYKYEGEFSFDSKVPF